MQGVRVGRRINRGNAFGAFKVRCRNHPRDRKMAGRGEKRMSVCGNCSSTLMREPSGLWTLINGGEYGGACKCNIRKKHFTVQLHM